MNARTTPVLVDLGVGALMPIGRVLRAYANEAKYELLRMLRTPAFALPFLVLPVPIYLFFGVVVPAAVIAKNPGVANYLFSGFSVFTVMGPALFGIGCGLAVERDAGLLTLKRALPVPSGGYLIAKILIGMAFAALAMILMLACAVLAGKITLSVPQLLIMFVVVVIGTVPFAAIGLFIGAFASGSAAPAYANIIYLPMLWLSGLFIPMRKFLEPWAVIWPAFHLNQVALGAAGVYEYSFVVPQISSAVLVGFTVLFGGVAIRRLARRG